MSTNPEAKYPHLLLTKPSDEYLLNLCKSTAWFVVELCEAIQVKKVCKIDCLQIIISLLSLCLV